MQVTSDTVVSIDYELSNSEGELIEKTDEPTAVKRVEGMLTKKAA